MEEWAFIPTPFQPSSIAKITDYDWAMLLANEVWAFSYIKGLEEIIEFRTYI